MNYPLKSLVILLLAIVVLSCKNNSEKELTEAQIDQYWKEGKTLPSSVFQKYPLPLQNIENDKGINVMIDLVHQCNFGTLWHLPGRLNELGYRSIGSQAAINKVITPDGYSRIRMIWDEENKIYPFAWHPNFSYNVIITHQSDFNAQNYLPEEQEALESFVNEGGGLLVFGKSPKNEKLAEQWSLNTLCKKFGAEFICKTGKYRETTYAEISYSEDWEVIAKNDNDNAVGVYRKYGKGHVIIYGSDELLHVDRKNVNEKTEKNELLNQAIAQVAKGKNPVGGEPRYPISRGGGGGIYPELEKHFNDIVVFYAANQKPELLSTLNEDIPKAKSLVEGWLPSLPTLEPMYLVLSSGGGGGWAVNAFKPKENGIISLSPRGIISIFAHELAHTMHGPVNEDGKVAGITPIPNRGEAHAGWFQGKVDAWFNPDLQQKAVKSCNKLFEFDESGKKLDLVTHYENNELRKEFGKGKDWIKTWWIWQKLDDRYSSAWYPRWKYVQHMRWHDEPAHRLSWDEMVEDMSIAVGEDLFPFLNSAGLSLEKQRLETIVFNGKKLKLDVAPIEVTAAGKVNLETIGDYKKGL